MREATPERENRVDGRPVAQGATTRPGPVGIWRIQDRASDHGEVDMGGSVTERWRYAHDVVAATTITILCVALSACSGAGEAAPAVSGDGNSTGVPTSEDLSPTAASIEAHMRFLASDELAGRAPGTEAFDVAARYVAGQLEEMGLTPLGSDGAYFQSIPLRTSRPANSDAELLIHRDDTTEALVQLQDYATDPEPGQESSSVTAPVVFAGFGIDAPEHGVADYAGLDVAGAIVLVFTGTPAQLPTDARAHLGRTDTKSRTAADRGAVGMLRVSLRVPGQPVSSGPGRRGGSGSLGWLGPGGVGHDPAPELRAGATLSLAAASRLFDGAARTFDDVAAEAAGGGSPTGLRLPVEVTLSQRTVYDSAFESPNVVAVVSGSDPVLRNEHVVITAHLDHVGVGQAQDGDEIYNGAGDNASGTAVLLAIAGMLRSTPPARSVIFAAVTAEERGLVGSDYFVRNPPVPAETIVANINLDSGVFLYDFADIIPFGTAYSTLGENVLRVASRHGLGIGGDPLPEEALFTRSDHYRFVQQGIPSMFFMIGTARDEDVDGLGELRGYVADHLHSPSDDMSLPWDFISAARYAHFVAAVARDVANDEQRPRWRQGNVFARPPHR